jgi:hypothetical protein
MAKRFFLRAAPLACGPREDSRENWRENQSLNDMHKAPHHGCSGGANGPQPPPILMTLPTKTIRQIKTALVPA